MALLEVDDLTPFATINDDKAQAMIDDATAMAALAAPCLADESSLTPTQMAAAKALLRAAILRWEDAGSGAVASETMGPFGVTVDTRQPRRNMFWPSEIAALQKICKGTGGVFSIDTAPDSPIRFRPVFSSSDGGGVFNVGAIDFDNDYPDDYFYG